MPSRPPAACNHPGCVNTSPCPDHPRARWAEGSRGRRMPKDWDATRRRILRRDGHRCQLCGATATEVDHIVRGVEHDGNLRALCRACHRVKTQAEAAEAGKAARERQPRESPGMPFSRSRASSRENPVPPGFQSPHSPL